MTLKSPEMFRRVIDTLNECVNVAETARRLRIDASTIFVWQRQSKAAANRKEDPSEFILEIDGERKYFHQFCSRVVEDAVAIGASNMLAQFKEGGRWVESRFQGAPVFETNPDYDDPEMRDLLGLCEGDRYLKDANGNRIRVMNFERTTDAANQFILGSHLRKRYGKESKLSIDMQARVSGGVVFANQQQPKKISAPLPLVEIVQEADADEPDLTVRSTDPDELPVANLDDDDAVVAKPMVSEPEPVITTPPPEAYRPTEIPLLKSQREGRPLSELERSLLAELPGAINRSRA
jgi:transposase-like protein